MESHEFEAIVREYRPRLTRYVAGLVGDPGHAEDVTQEALARVHRGLPALQAPEARTTWIFRIASNVAFDHLKSRAARESSRTASLDADADGPGPSALPDDERSAEDRLEQSEMAACLQQYIHRLSPPLRASLLLRDLEGLSEQAAAEALGCSVAAVKVRTHRARKALRAMLQAECSFYDDARGVFRCDPGDSRREPPARGEPGR